MNAIKRLLEWVFTAILAVWLIGGYIFGLYTLAFNDRYNTKELLLGLALPPYPIYIGTKEAFWATGKQTKYELTDKGFIIYHEKRPLVDFVAHLNNSINPPVMVDKATKLLSVTTDGKNIIFTSQLVSDLGFNKKEIRTVLSSMFLRSKIQYCDTQKYKEYNEAIIEQDIGMTTVYLDNNSNIIGESTLDESRCKEDEENFVIDEEVHGGI